MKKYLNYEMSAYLVAGVLTTLVNIAVFWGLKNIIHIDILAANALAWIVSVVFAYYVNNRYVFLQNKCGIKEESVKILKFIGARLFSFAVDEAGIWLLVGELGINDLFSKVVMNIIVIIINYIFSKLFIFNTGAYNQKNSNENGMSYKE